jgi:peptide/nickel transport system substrate-binding protein
MLRKTILATALAALLAVPVAEANTLRWGAARDIGSLDPYSFGDTFTLSVLNHVYEGLVRYDAELKIEPALATRWETVSPTTWRFHLRRGVVFHNGNPFTADDVLASLERVSHPNSPLRGNLPAFRSASKVDDFTVDIELTGSYPLLLNDLTNIYIFDREWLVANNATLPTDAGRGVEGFATNNANGTGPFVVDSRRPDARTVFTANPRWWDERRHNLTRIELLPIASSATRVAAMLSGEIDFTNVAPLQDLPRLQAAQDVRVMQSSELRTVFFVLNQGSTLTQSDIRDRNPLRDRRVREAMYRAIDIDGLHRRVMRGLSRNTGSIIAPAIPGFAPDLDQRLPYDPARARALLTEAGFPNGFSFVFSCLNDGLVSEEEICQAVAAMWSRIGLRPTLSIAPRAVETPKRVRGEFDVATLGWANEPMIDAYSILVQVLHSRSGTAGVFNWGGWGSPRIDELTQRASGELDNARRIPLMTEALRLVRDEVMFIPLHQQPMAWAARRNVETMVQLSDNKPRLWLTRMR